MLPAGPSPLCDDAYVRFRGQWAITLVGAIILGYRAYLESPRRGTSRWAKRPYAVSVADARDDEITVSTAAKLLGVQPNSVYALIDRGELHAEVDRPADRPGDGESFGFAAMTLTSTSSRRR